MSNTSAEALGGTRVSGIKALESAVYESRRTLRVIRGNPESGATNHKNVARHSVWLRQFLAPPAWKHRPAGATDLLPRPNDIP